MRKKRYIVKIEYNQDPGAPTFEEYMDNDVNPWIEELIMNYMKSQKSEVPDANHHK